MAVGDDTGKVSVDFIGKGGKVDGGYGRKKKRAISAQNMQPAQSARKIYNFPH